MEGPVGSDTPAARSSEDGDRLNTLYAEAKSAIGYATNQLRSVTDRYREWQRLELHAWHRDRDALARLEDQARAEAGRMQGAATPEPSPGAEEPPVVLTAADRESAGSAESAADIATEIAAEAAAAEAVRQDLRRSVDITGSELGEHQRDLSRLELVTRGLENAWLFLERDDASLMIDDGVPVSGADMRMRIVEAQERERVRLAQEIHDGPAQMIANAFFQVDYVERLMERDPRLARTELRYLREVMRRELADIRGFIGQLRPPALEETGLEGAIREAISTFASSAEVRMETRLDAPTGMLNDTQQLVVLRVLQEALQNTRKHAAARTVSVTTSAASGEWTLEVRDDGRGFDVDSIGARGRHNFGLQFMRERAELIGGSVVVRSRPGAGTVVRLTIEGEGQPG